MLSEEGQSLLLFGEVPEEALELLEATEDVVGKVVESAGVAVAVMVTTEGVELLLSGINWAGH